MQAGSSKLSINEIFCLAAIVTVCCFSAFIWHDLWTPDEPRVAAITLEMAETGNFIVPRLAGAPFVEKPPLYFATAALMLKMIGPLTGPTAAIRLTTVFFGLGVLLMTFLITRRLWDTRTGILAMAILATMEGFIENSHWIRVDAALSFFVVAAIWCFVEIYLEYRKALLPLAGLFLAGAFLSKGFIGLVLAAVPWTSLVIIWMFSQPRREKQSRRFVIRHLWVLLIFGIVSGTWMVLLYIKGGPTLWNEWFWVNQVGRFTGQSHTGHIKPGQPFYYVIQIIGYGLPWTPMFLYWFGTTAGRLIKQRAISREALFLCIWGAGSIVLLTIPATKRGLYLLPVLPVFAIMAAVSLKQLTSKWFKWYAGFWIALCLIIITTICILPLAPVPLPEVIPAQVKAVLVVFSYYHVLTGALLMLCLVVVVRFRKIVAPEYIMVLVTAGLFASLLGVPIHALDQEKSLAADVRHFAAQVPDSKREHIAGFGFSETMRGAFYYYTDWRVPQVMDKNRVKKILAGQDHTYESLLVNYRSRHHTPCPLSNIVACSYWVLIEMATGADQGRRVLWVKGWDANATPEETPDQWRLCNQQGK